MAWRQTIRVNLGPTRNGRVQMRTLRLNRPIARLCALTGALAMAVVTSLSLSAPAHAHDWHKRHTHRGTDAAIAAGVAGLIIGGLIASSNQRTRTVRHGDHCHGRYCHRHSFHQNHYHRRSGAVHYQRPQRVKRVQRVIRAELPHRHYRWCDAKYRSYRAYDNSFQPYHGSRKQCVSPYY